MTVTGQPKTYRGTRIRSFRVPDARWDRARRRAEAEGTNLSAEVNAYLEAYGAGSPSRAYSDRLNHG